MTSINFLELDEREVFILRIWKSIEKTTPLRGQIQHVRTGQTFPLREPAVLLNFVQEHVVISTDKESLPSGIK